MNQFTLIKTVDGTISIMNVAKLASSQLPIIYSQLSAGYRQII